MADSVLIRVAHPSPAVHRPALKELSGLTRQMHLPESDFLDRLRHVIEREWSAVGPARHELVDPLVSRFRSPDTSMVDMEVIAAALALQGEDGLTELVSFVKSDDFILRHKAAVGLGALDRSARWAVPTLLRVLTAESQPLVQKNILAALGNIGGSAAVAALERIYSVFRKTGEADAELLAAVEGALASARLSP